MSQVVTNPTPKAAFQESAQNISKHRDMIASGEFGRAAMFALLEYQRILCQNTPPENFNFCAASHFKMLGAQEFLHTLRNLAESPKVPVIVPDGNLDHKA